MSFISNVEQNINVFLDQLYFYLNLSKWFYILASIALILLFINSLVSASRVKTLRILVNATRQELKQSQELLEYVTDLLENQFGEYTGAEEEGEVLNE
ncbi:hypothetical protein [Sinanaerobacter chloroacetimidivorans]|uniref:Uncharacterized protein n=1 Tax=Sinanaerobacter chloroacetimidivorans TaxID=2818044 RepID=A0A8J7VX12_9FIRM|nr:hypothetical protein [Sinanaerobacter chloroacetimidivorans]MBR0596592.1 hypothetical protein [Sinanaerobacter chloroacetimidivorans]